MNLMQGKLMKEEICGVAFFGESSPHICRRKKGHKGYHSAIIYWYDKDTLIN